MEPRVDRIIRLAEAIASALVRRHCLNDEPDKPGLWNTKTQRNWKTSPTKLSFHRKRNIDYELHWIAIRLIWSYMLTCSHIYLYSLPGIDAKLIVWYLVSCFVVASLWHASPQAAKASSTEFLGVHIRCGEMDHHGGSESFAWQYVALVWTAQAFPPHATRTWPPSVLCSCA